MAAAETATLEERVREIIGNGGPQLSVAEYEQRIESELDHMTPRELLELISRALDES